MVYANLNSKAFAILLFTTGCVTSRLVCCKCLCLWSEERFSDCKCWTFLFHWFLSSSGEAPYLCIPSPASVITLRYRASTARHRRTGANELSFISNSLSGSACATRGKLHKRFMPLCSKITKPVHRSFIRLWLCGCQLVKESCWKCSSLSWFVPLSFILMLCHVCQQT